MDPDGLSSVATKLSQAKEAIISQENKEKIRKRQEFESKFHTVFSQLATFRNSLHKPILKSNADHEIHKLKQEKEEALKTLENEKPFKVPSGTTKDDPVMNPFFARPSVTPEKQRVLFDRLSAPKAAPTPEPVSQEVLTSPRRAKPEPELEVLFERLSTPKHAPPDHPTRSNSPPTPVWKPGGGQLTPLSPRTPRTPRTHTPSPGPQLSRARHVDSEHAVATPRSAPRPSQIPTPRSQQQQGRPPVTPGGHKQASFSSPIRERLTKDLRIDPQSPQRSASTSKIITRHSTDSFKSATKSNSTIGNKAVLTLGRLELHRASSAQSLSSSLPARTGLEGWLDNTSNSSRSKVAPYLKPEGSSPKSTTSHASGRDRPTLQYRTPWHLENSPHQPQQQQQPRNLTAHPAENQTQKAQTETVVGETQAPLNESENKETSVPLETEESPIEGTPSQITNVQNDGHAVSEQTEQQTSSPQEHAPIDENVAEETATPSEIEGGLYFPHINGNTMEVVCQLMFRMHERKKSTKDEKKEEEDKSTSSVNWNLVFTEQEDNFEKDKQLLKSAGCVTPQQILDLFLASDYLQVEYIPNLCARLLAQSSPDVLSTLQSLPDPLFVLVASQMAPEQFFTCLFPHSADDENPGISISPTPAQLAVSKRLLNHIGQGLCLPSVVQNFKSFYHKFLVLRKEEEKRREESDDLSLEFMMQSENEIWPTEIAPFRADSIEGLENFPTFFSIFTELCRVPSEIPLVDISPKLSNLSVLQLFCAQKGLNNAARLFLECGAFGKISRLSLVGCTSLNESVVNSIVRQCSPILTFLDLSNVFNVSDATLEIIGNHLHHLETLVVAGCKQITDKGFIHMLSLFPKNSHLSDDTDPSSNPDNSKDFLAQLTRPELLGFTPAGTNTTHQFSASILTPPIKRLNVRGCVKLTNKAFEVIGDTLLNMEDLCAYGCFRLTDDGLTALGSRFSRLRRLCFCGAYKVTDVGRMFLFNVNPSLVVYNNSEEFGKQ